MRADSSSWIDLDARLLRTWPLPEIAPDADKEVRGRVLAIAGSREIPGAAVLAGKAALRAGAGKLVIATAQSVAAELAIAVPEARVIALPDTPAGAFAPLAVNLLEQTAQAADAVLIGPGLMEEGGSHAFVASLLPSLAHVPVSKDAVLGNPQGAAAEAAREWNAVVALKGAVTLIAPGARTQAFAQGIASCSRCRPSRFNATDSASARASTSLQSSRR